MPAPWQQLLRLLAQNAPGTVPYWRMKNDAEFYLAIPDRDDIWENGFSHHVGFPFSFDDVKSLTFQSATGSARLEITNDLHAVRAVVSSVDGFTHEELASALVVRPTEPSRSQARETGT
jgi:hypothetical protein